METASSIPWENSEQQWRIKVGKRRHKSPFFCQLSYVSYFIGWRQAGDIFGSAPLGIRFIQRTHSIVEVKPTCVPSVLFFLFCYQHNIHKWTITCCLGISIPLPTLSQIKNLCFISYLELMYFAEKAPYSEVIYTWNESLK